MSKKQNNSLVPMISTIIVAVLAIAVAVTAVILLTGDKGETSSAGGTSDQQISSETVFRPTQELIDECTYAAHDLVAGSYRIVRLFVTDGLDHFDEPYGNKPEDGIYTVNSKEYTSLSEIEELVRSIYTEDVAKLILTDIDGNGLAVYQNREVLVKVEEPLPEEGEEESDTTESETTDGTAQYKTELVLGISADFVPAADYKKDWSSCRIAVVPVSESECKLTVYLDGLSPETVTDADKDSILEMSMVKSEDNWRLTKFVY
ncbi:MAG: hypothetical protein IJO91_09770 [Oscillospiraceae bacterium]|nr:hypothetical protein [Oscillospiraceae bacterium]